ncbi:MAG: methyl-accepting chemotaxis protein, partial [Burkholderiales bacterium]
FAVVAEEVRKLAEQSQEAAKQITGLIEEIQSDTEAMERQQGKERRLETDLLRQWERQSFLHKLS